MSLCNVHRCAIRKYHLVLLNKFKPKSYFIGILPPDHLLCTMRTAQFKHSWNMVKRSTLLSTSVQLNFHYRKANPSCIFTLKHSKETWEFCCWETFRMPCHAMSSQTQLFAFDINKRKRLKVEIALHLEYIQVAHTKMICDIVLVFGWWKCCRKLLWSFLTCLIYWNSYFMEQVRKRSPKMMVSVAMNNGNHF